MSRLADNLTSNFASMKLNPTSEDQSPTAMTSTSSTSSICPRIDSAQTAKEIESHSSDSIVPDPARQLTTAECELKKKILNAVGTLNAIDKELWKVMSPDAYTRLGLDKIGLLHDSICDKIDRQETQHPKNYSRPVKTKDCRCVRA